MLHSHRQFMWRLTAIVVAAACGRAAADNLQVVSITPSRHALNAPIDTTIVIDFDRAVLAASITPANVRVFGRASGTVPWTFSLSNGDTRVTLTQAAGHSLAAGEVVLINLSHSLMGADLTTLRAAGYAQAFWTRTSPAILNYTQIAQFSNRSDPDIPTRIYGACATDLNGDGAIDLCTVNEDSHDLRVCLNLADGSGLFGPFLPPHPIGVEASPNEPADFNNDGHSDVAAAATMSNSVWISLGNGDGTFTPAQSVGVGFSPHGIAVLDVDGDGDLDIATSNTSSSNVSLMLNNGSGVFGASTSFEGGGNGEYGLSSGDMNNDGISDLIVGAISSQTIIVHLGNGNGTFTALAARPAGGSVWMVTTAEVNGDGNLDVTTANSSSNSGSILLGNGTGLVGAPSVTPTAQGCVATDLGDLDGDGDLDWVLSSFGGGRWRLFTNNGLGVFTFNQEFVAVSNSSCATFVDFDNDRDLDIVLTDEVADVIQLKRNKGPVVDGDMNCDGRINGKDVAPFVKALLDPAGYAAQFSNCVLQNADVNDDSVINSADVAPFADLLTVG